MMARMIMGDCLAISVSSLVSAADTKGARLNRAYYQLATHHTIWSPARNGTSFGTGPTIATQCY